MLCTLSGASGVGKTTVIKDMLADRPDTLLLRSVTTRSRRQSDAEGEYLYLSPDDFQRRCEASEFAWLAGFDSARYGTLVDDLHTALLSDKIYLAAITPETIPKVQDLALQLGVASRLSSVYILSPRRNILRNRMTQLRGETSEVVERKLKECSAWDAEALRSGIYQLFIQDHDDLDRKVRAVLKHIRRI